MKWGGAREKCTTTNKRDNKDKKAQRREKLIKICQLQLQYKSFAGREEGGRHESENRREREEEKRERERKEEERE